jgi:Domain of unknown function (DUF4277)
MEAVSVERLDPLGVLSEVIKDLGLMELIDARLVPEDQEESTPGEAVAGMMRNSLGFSPRPVALPPQFFAHKPLDLLFREGVRAEMFHRCTLGRPRDAVSGYGCDRLLRELAVGVGARAGMDWRCNHLDTTSVSLTGDDVPDSAARAMMLTPGYATDHRPDWQQAVWARMVSQDGGVPCVRKSWEGQAADSQSFQERAAALLATFPRSPSPRSLVAASTLSHEDPAVHLQGLGFLTRLPGTLQLVSQVLRQALGGDNWQHVDDTTRDQRLELGHYGMAQRGRVVYAEAACERAAATSNKAKPRAAAAIETQLFHLHAQGFATPEAAPAALGALENGGQYHQRDPDSLIEHTRSGGTGRPPPTTPIKAIEWHLRAQGRLEETTLEERTPYHAGCVLGTNIGASQLCDADVIAPDKGQSQGARGFRFLKDPLCFVSSLLVKKPARVPGWLMGMTGALWVYAVAQRRLRHQ